MMLTATLRSMWADAKKTKIAKSTVDMSSPATAYAYLLLYCRLTGMSIVFWVSMMLGVKYCCQSNLYSSS